MSEAQRIGDELWELPVGTVPGMRVPARVFADAELLAAIEQDRSLEQLANVATLPGIRRRPGHARHPPGVRVSGWGRGGDRRIRGRDLARRGRLRH
ncbi:MAG TPA: hypothetical protein VLC49_05525 [Solirubrobacteraceae bacterium]|nr:hypothetical protein [Solirubrobacteraceae bacterium]